MKRISATLLLAVALCAGHAQTNAPASLPPLPPQVNVQPAAPGTGLRSAVPTAAGAPTALPGNEPRVPGFQLMNAPITAALDYYEQFTGKFLIKEGTLAGNNITINIQRELPKSEAIRILEAALLLNGVSITPFSENAVKVVGVASKNPRGEGIPIFDDPKLLPKGDEVISFFIPLRNVAPQDAIAIFQSHLAPHPYTAFVPVPGAQAIVITENANNIRRILQLREYIDVPPAKVATEFVPLERADAEIVAETIRTLLEKRETAATPTPTGARPPAARAPGQPPLPGAAADAPAAAGAEGAQGPNESALVAGDVRLIADRRTNRILVITRPTNLDYIKKLIHEFDSAVSLSNQLERPLRYISATEVLPVLQELITEGSEGSGTAGATGTPGSIRPPGSTGGNLRGGGTSTGRSSGGMGGASSGGGSLSRADQLDAPAEDTPPVSVSVGKTRLIANPKANSIIVFGPPDARQKVSDMLDLLDQRPRQVYLSTVIGQLTVGDNLEFGVDIFSKFANSRKGGGAGGSRNTDLGLVDPRNLVSITNFAALAAGLTLVGTSGDLTAYVKALEDSNRFRVLSRPSIYAANNKRSVIESGSQVPVPTSTLTDVSNGNNLSSAVTANIGFRDVVLKLEVIPLINANNEVTLTVAQQNDSITGTQVISNNEVPIIGTQSIETTVTVPNRAVIVLGGLITDTSEKTDSGVPYLSRIPVLGWAFKNQNRKKSRTELIILMQPTVVDAPENYVAASHEEGARAIVTPSARNMARPPAEFARPEDVRRPRADFIRPARPGEEVPSSVVPAPVIKGKGGR
jgi:type II secretion system protein D